MITADQSESAESLTAAIETAGPLVEQSEAAVAVEFMTSAAYWGSVISDLVTTVAAEYREAVSGDEISLLIEYQDAYAFTNDARDLYGTTSDEVEIGAAQSATEIENAFETLAAAFPGAQPPTVVALVGDIVSATAQIADALEASVGALAVVAVAPLAEQAAIEELLDRIGDLVEAGDRTQAAELAAEAYLEHYELIEPDVIEAAPDVNAELEPLLGAELRRQINSGEPLETIRSTIVQAKELLTQAINALGEQH